MDIIKKDKKIYWNYLIKTLKILILLLIGIFVLNEAKKLILLFVTSTQNTNATRDLTEGLIKLIVGIYMEIIGYVYLFGTRNSKDRLMKKTIYLVATFNIIIVFLIFLFILKNSTKFFDEYSIVKFFSGKEWISLSEIYGLLPLLAGSAWVTFIALSIAVPISIVTAVYISKFANKNMRETLKIIIETMAAIPSVVLGYIGLAVIAGPIQKMFNLSTGLTAFTGGVILAFMALPTMISISDDSIRALDESYEKASLALGANRVQTIVKVILPAAFPGIFAGIMLGFGRIIGETMTVLMVTGNAANITTNPLMPVRTMTATIAAEMGEVVNGSAHYYSLFTIGLVLFGITFMTNTLADFFINRARKKMKG